MGARRNESGFEPSDTGSIHGRTHYSEERQLSEERQFSEGFYYSADQQNQQDRPGDGEFMGRDRRPPFPGAGFNDRRPVAERGMPEERQFGENRMRRPFDPAFAEDQPFSESDKFQEQTGFGRGRDFPGVRREVGGVILFYFVWHCQIHPVAAITRLFYIWQPGFLYFFYR